jgi:hypothetical protein
LIPSTAKNKKEKKKHSNKINFISKDYVYFIKSAFLNNFSIITQFIIFTTYYSLSGKEYENNLLKMSASTAGYF